MGGALLHFINTYRKVVESLKQRFRCVMQPEDSSHRTWDETASHLRGRCIRAGVQQQDEGYSIDEVSAQWNAILKYPFLVCLRWVERLFAGGECITSINIQTLAVCPDEERTRLIRHRQRCGGRDRFPYSSEFEWYAASAIFPSALSVELDSPIITFQAMPNDLLSTLSSPLMSDEDEFLFDESNYGPFELPFHTFVKTLDDTKMEARYCDKERSGQALRFRFIAQKIHLQPVQLFEVPSHAYLVAELFDHYTGLRLSDAEQRMLVFRAPRQQQASDDAPLFYDGNTPYLEKRHSPSGDGSFTISFGLLSPTTFFNMQEVPERELFVRFTIHQLGIFPGCDSCDSLPFRVTKENQNRRKRRRLSL
ncbi:hypothetical protein PROFUN_14584 [Planoprotostelium fungivorum]|uniref:Uncharacterized protein n=1 Tax=Planoprotostelium fungivorum TaxID=1890364 RepID=A0A2P6MZK9_9EUKA|nr:hypothetical protein PROFUN_14584 [Planoprotostelium fungivorum]